MNLEQLKDRAAQITEVDGVRIKKLNAVDGMAYSKHFAAVPSDAPPEETVTAYAFLLSKCVVDENGVATLDTDEGRAALRELDFATFSKLGEAAIEWNLGNSKKN